MTTSEAVLSSRIEGTQATMGDVLEYEASGDTDKFSEKRIADIHEVLNYRRAMQQSIEMLKELPLCSRILKTVHETLLNSVRGHGKGTGEYRKNQNWVGPMGCSQEDAKFIPISVDKLPEGMSSWDKYVNSDQPDRLIQLAIIHAEFEALHPFWDGNGRLGRICIPLFMYQNKLIKEPMFYISAYFEKHRDEYYGRLLSVSKDHNWTDWCIFFLKAVQAQAEENQQKAMGILRLYDQMKVLIQELTHSQYAMHTLDWIFQKPNFKSSDFVSASKIPKPTASRILNVLKKEGILASIEPGRGSRSSILIFRELINLVEGHKIF